MVLVCMMGVSLCEQSGTISCSPKRNSRKLQGSDLKVMVIFLSVVFWQIVPGVPDG